MWSNVLSGVIGAIATAIIFGLWNLWRVRMAARLRDRGLDLSSRARELLIAMVRQTHEPGVALYIAPPRGSRYVFQIDGEVFGDPEDDAKQARILSAMNELVNAGYARQRHRDVFEVTGPGYDLVDRVSPQSNAPGGSEVRSSLPPRAHKLLMAMKHNASEPGAAYLIPTDSDPAGSVLIDQTFGRDGDAEDCAAWRAAFETLIQRDYVRPTGRERWQLSDQGWRVAGGRDTTALPRAAG